LKLLSALQKKKSLQLSSAASSGPYSPAETKEEIGHMLNRSREKFIDIFKLKIKRTEESILLLDGMDEFLNKDYSNQQYFWRDLNDEWEVSRNQFKDFGRVIIAVREQFLQYPDQAKEGLNSHVINNTEMFYLRLQPFTNEQISQYIEKRYTDPETLRKVRQTAAYFRRNETLSFGDLPLLSIPLTLNYIEDLSEESLKHAAELSNRQIVDKYDVYSIIVNKWLEREEVDKAVTTLDLRQSLTFCEDLAFRLAGSGNNFSITEHEFVEFEEQFFSRVGGETRKSFISHFGDRSLLLKEGVGLNAVIKFAHPSFMEYFLAGYAQKAVELGDRALLVKWTMFSAIRFSVSPEKYC